MSIVRDFVLAYYPKGSSDLQVNGENVTNQSLVLFYDTVEDGQYLSTVVDGYLSLVDGEYSLSKSKEDGSSYEVFFNIEGIDPLHAPSFTYVAGFGETFTFRITSDAMIFCLQEANLLPSSGASLDFSVDDLDGNYGAYSNGTIVNVLGRDGDYEILASQSFWAFPASDFQSNSIIYKLQKDGKILLAPHFLLTLKAL